MVMSDALQIKNRQCTFFLAAKLQYGAEIERTSGGDREELNRNERSEMERSERDGPCSGPLAGGIKGAKKDGGMALERDAPWTDCGETPNTVAFSMETEESNHR